MGDLRQSETWTRDEVQRLVTRAYRMGIAQGDLSAEPRDKPTVEELMERESARVAGFGWKESN